MNLAWVGLWRKTWGSSEISQTILTHRAVWTQLPEADRGECGGLPPGVSLGCAALVCTAAPPSPGQGGCAKVFFHSNPAALTCGQDASPEVRSEAEKQLGALLGLPSQQCPRLGGFNNRHLQPHSLEAGRPRSRCPRGWFLAKLLFLARRRPPSRRGPTRPFLCPRGRRKSALVSLPLSS